MGEDKTLLNANDDKLDSVYVGPSALTLNVTGNLRQDLTALLGLYGLKAVYDYGEGWMLEAIS